MLKLYVWENVLCDYSCGMAVALAENEKQAKEYLKQKMEDDSGFYTPGDFKKKPQVISQPAAFYVWGGA